MSVSQRKKWQDHEGTVLAAVNSFDVIDCECCGFKHVVPIPTEKELETVYAHEYYTQEKPLYIERYIEDKEWWDVVYTERYKSLERLLGNRKGRLLDVGSGPGLFLALGRSRGWIVKGIEPSEKAALYSQRDLGLDVENVFLDERSAPRLGKFDVVHMGEVLEHIPDPAGMLNLVRGLLLPGGILTLIVPNDFNPFQKILQNDLGFSPWWVAPPHHLNYFTHESLCKLVEYCGYVDIEQESTFPIDLFLLMGENYIGNDEIGRRVHGLRKNFDINLLNSAGTELRSILYKSFAKLGLGREIVLYAKVPSDG
jgi:SAM-dependent methyltransferase